MRARACVAALALLVSGIGTASPAVAEQKVARRPAVWVVGDSVTVYSEDPLRSRFAATTDGRIEIDAEIGRNVVLLEDLVRQQLARTGRPRTMVLALGTNPDPEWTLSDFRRVLDSIPDSITVVLVTVYRSPGNVSAAVSQQMTDYSRWMRTLAASRDNICLAPWRGRVRAHADEYLLDGVHPNDRGALVFADVVADAVESCVEA